MRDLKPVIPSLLAAFLCLLATGCFQSPSQREGIFPVSGSLTVNGEPAEYANVILVPTDPDLPRAYGVVDSEGEFRLSTKREFDGAKPGEYFVTISWMKPKNPNVREPDYGPELLPPNFQDPVKSGLKVVIEPTTGELEPIDVKI